MTRDEHMKSLTDADYLMFDEIDETVLEYPYTFLPNSTT